jgi:pimeloyl-ACP methyl ester carboxylesterase
METVRSDDAEIVYESWGQGPPVLLLHPFPVHRDFWKPAAQALSKYRIILPDLRGHGASGIGDGAATMAKHATDIARVLDHAGVGRVPMVGVSIGGYAIFECWRRYAERISALVLCNTKASADTAEGRAARLRSAAEVLKNGVAPFVESMLPKLVGQTTRASRPDLLNGVRDMALAMSPEDVSQVQQGMAERPDSVATLQTIRVPTLIIAGEEDILTPVADAETMKANAPNSRLTVISKAGHYAAWEKPEEVGMLLRQFLDAQR